MSKAIWALSPMRIFEARIDASDKRVFAGYKVQVDFVAHQLGHIHFGFDLFSVNIRRDEIAIMHIFGADAKDDIFIGVCIIDFCVVGWDRQG